VCVVCTVEKILFGLPPAVTVVKDNYSILDTVHRNSLLPAVSDGGMRSSLSAPPPLITHTDATPQSSPNEATGRHALSPLQCPSLNDDTTLSPHSTSSHQVSTVPANSLCPSLSTASQLRNMYLLFNGSVDGSQRPSPLKYQIKSNQIY